MREWLMAHYDALKDFSTPFVTLLGFSVSTGLAIAGLNTFARWKRQKIEERRIETAIDALAIAYESKIIFRRIRSSGSDEYETKDMATKDGESPGQRALRGAHWVVGKRINDNREYFDRVWKLQPIAMAIFGEHMEDVFGKLHEARALIGVASQTLTWDEPPGNTEDNRKLREQLRHDLWGGSEKNDRVQVNLDAFRNGIEKICKPFVEREFGAGYVRGVSHPR